MLRRTQMSRGSGFRRPEYVRPEPAPLRPAGRSGVITMVGGSVVSIAKDVTAKPGKRAPNKEERAWMDAVVRYGCVACRLDGHASRPCAVHHILRGGQRIGHLFTIGLCDPGHHQGGQQFDLISRHPWKARFEERYGTEMGLLAQLRLELGYGESKK